MKNQTNPFLKSLNKDNNDQKKGGRMLSARLTDDELDGVEECLKFLRESTDEKWGRTRLA